MTVELDLFGDAPLTSPELPKLEGVWGAINVKWTAWRGAHRPCDDCTARIHQLGAGKAPYPVAATRRRQGPNGDLFLCPADAQARKELDDAAEVEHKRRLAENAAQTAEDRKKWAKRRKPREGMS